MNTDFIKGVIVPIITVIDEEEKINEAAMRAQVDYVINGGLHGILAFGSNGEFYQIEEEEMERGFKIMVDQAAGRVPVYFGIGAINTKKCVRLAKMAVANGAAGISILQPMFLKPNFNELFLHFKTIAEAVPEILEQCKDKGYQVVGVSELFAIKGKKLMTGVKYNNAE